MSLAPWWRERAVVRRCLADLIAAELAWLRRSGAGLPPRPWPDGLRLDRELTIDSLERTSLATAVAEFTHLHRTGIEDALLARRTLGAWVDIVQAGQDAYSEELTFRTSGSTGEPRSCTHRLVALQQEVEELATIFHGTRRILTAVPSHHIYGFLFTVLLPRALGISKDDVPDLRWSSPALLAGRARDGDLIVGHPDFWRMVTRAAPALPTTARGVTSSAPCPDAVSASIPATGLGDLYHVYGSSETAGIGWRTSYLHPYQLFTYWQPDASGPDRLLRHEPGGVTRSVTVPDHLEWIDARQFRVGARRDDAVQVGGINVYPALVRDLLRQHPQVKDAAVRLMRPDEGTRLKAFIVPGSDITDLAAFESALREWIAATMPAPQRPQALQFGATVPVSDAGKLADWEAGR